MAEIDEELAIPEVTRETVADDVRAAFEQHTADVADKLVNSTEETAAEKADRQRNERGQFVAKDKVETPEAAPESITDADRREEKTVQPSTAGGPPTSWSAGEKAEWSKLPTAVQAAVIRREQEINEGGRQWSEQRRNYEQAIGPVAQLAQEYQLPVGDAIQRLVNVERRLADRAQAPQVIAELAQAYGVNLAALANGTQQPQQQTAPFDPNRLTQTISQTVAQQIAQAREADRQEAETQGIITSFASEPGHEHFNAVKVLMGHLLQSGQADSMQDAYDKAIWATPSVREQLVAQQNKPITVDRVNKAKRAAVSLNGAPRGAQPASRTGNSNGSVVDDVRAAFEQHAG